QGAYVDLNYNGAITYYALVNGINISTFTAAQQQLLTALTTSNFSGPGDSRSGLQGTLYTPSVYDTGSWSYEHDGIDQDGSSVPDQATNGIENNGDGIVDDRGELEAPPPYATPLRGIQIKIRCFEPDSQQIREVTIVQEFVPG